MGEEGGGGWGGLRGAGAVGSFCVCLVSVDGCSRRRLWYRT